MLVFQADDEKRKKFALKRIGTLLAVVVVMVGFAALWHYSEPLNWFTLEHVQVVGNHRVSSEEIRNVLDLHSGTGLFYLDLHRLERKLEKLTWVKSAQIRRTLPDILTINIQEYDPTAVLIKDKPYLISSEGNLLSPPPMGYVINLPVITNYNGTIPKYGEKIDNVKFLEAINVLSDIKQFHLFGRISEVRFANSYQYRVFMDDGKIELLLGKKHRESISAVENFLRNVPSGVNWSEIAYIDARTPGFIALNNQSLQTILSKPADEPNPQKPDKNT